MMKREIDVLIYGDLAALDLVFGEYLARRGLRVIVARKNREGQNPTLHASSDFHQALSAESVLKISSPWQLIRIARKARVIVTIIGALGFALNWRWPLRGLFGLPPVINIAAGSDFSELLSEKSHLGFFYRYFVRKCFVNLTVPYPHIVKNIVGQRIRNFSFLRFPYLLPPPPPVMDTTELRTGPLRFFHPSHIDFKINDPGDHRNSSKGNDRFLRALLKAFDDGFDAQCTILYRGPDRDIARKMTDNSHHSARFIWKDTLSRDDLNLEIGAADIVVDQFDVGGLGGIAIEAMAMGKPVLVYLHPGCLDLLYPDHPPVINAYHEVEIYQALWANADRRKLMALGRAAQRWVYSYHSGDTCIEPLLLYYFQATGHNVSRCCQTPELSVEELPDARRNQ
ncbi:MAG: glycosyltransferase [Pseudomonadota bacterium]|nr:glycosyltransferase [Pseudomonadota bacterium]